MKQAASNLASRLPPSLAPLAELAYNYWWSWQPEGPRLFQRLQPERWERCSFNPVRLLRELSTDELDAAAHDPAIVEGAQKLHAALAAELNRPFAPAPPASAEAPIVFACAEYGVHASLPIYSGGLGVLAGDYLKEASDQALPVCAVGLLYRQGYFHQRLDPSGWQHESWTAIVPEDLPMALVTRPGGGSLRIAVSLRGHDVLAQVWRVQVGRIPLYLLDTALSENAIVDRWITSRLYTGDRDLRLLQYALLGIGGARLMRALEVKPAIVHMNEGHAALWALELLPEQRDRLVFTTHTPIAAGNESYGWDDVARLLGPLPELRRLTGDRPALGLTELALVTSRSRNAVSRRHGEVARGMWQHLWPGQPVPITHVTNGVHAATWMAPPMRTLLGPTPDWSRIHELPDEALWAVRNAQRARLVDRIRERSVADRLARGESLDYAEGAARTFDPHTLTIGFARRIASYKRLYLLVRDARRALALLGGPRPIQVVIAGKAHPRDDDAKRLVQAIFALKAEPNAALRVAFLEDYDLELAAELVAGCDVWVNLPRPPLEASGTSGIKAALNGGLNLSVLDGWWLEAWNGHNGWAIRSEPGPDDAAQDARDADALYGLLEHEVVPLFYAREDGLPRGWLARIKASLQTVGGGFTMSRMLRDYLAQVYALA